MHAVLRAAVVAAAARGTAYLPATGVAFVHLLAYGSWLGSIVWSEWHWCCAALCMDSPAGPWQLHRSNA